MKLDLSGNDIKSLRGVDFPDTLFEINLGDNLIEDLVGVKFPTGLKRLLLCKNKLTNFEEVQFPSGLRHLGLAVNYISDLSLCSIEFPQELQILDLRANVYLNCLSKVRLPHNLLEIDLSCNNFLREMAYMYFPESLKEMRYEECYLGYRNEVYDIYLPWGVDIKNSYARRQLCYAKCDFVSRAILKKVKYARFAPSAWWVRISYMLGGVVFQEYDSAFYKYFTI